MTAAPIIVCFRQDLRLDDNPALHAAALSGRPVLPVFVHAQDAAWPMGAAQRCWLHHNLAELGRELEARGSRLVLRTGPIARELGSLARASGATAVYWNRRFEPAAAAQDSALARDLSARVEVVTFNARVLFEPEAVATSEGRPYRVFTPFRRACLAAAAPAAAPPAPALLRAPAAWPPGVAPEELGLMVDHAWARALMARWPPGERAAVQRLQRFLDRDLATYQETRDQPALHGVSGLSPYLAIGAIGPRRIWHAVRGAPEVLADGGRENAASVWLRQLLWREFAYHLLHHFPHTADSPLRPEFARMAWLEDASRLRAWQAGRTGYPLVDAGMRELWATGYMHNRVRMIVASFLCKHLGIHWLRGAEWFWDTLLDADLANNTLGWQWTAGCGADAAPYFRIFNPVSQGRRFDARGDYVRRWIPELARETAATVHLPGARNGYPPPLIDLGPARAAALARYADMRR